MQYAASFHCLVEEWKDCEELKPKPKEKCGFSRIRKKDETSNGVARGNQQLSVHEMWKRKQIHEDGRKMHGTKIFVKMFRKNGEGVNWEVMRNS